MPDLDKVERTLPAAWRAPYKLVKGEHPIDEVARAVVKVLTRTLREKGGVPRLLELAKILLMSLLERYSAEWERFPVQPPGWRFGCPDLSTDWRFSHAC